jgi:hypothetical protein
MPFLEQPHHLRVYLPINLKIIGFFERCHCAARVASIAAIDDAWGMALAVEHYLDSENLVERVARHGFRGLRCAGGGEDGKGYAGKHSIFPIIEEGRNALCPLTHGSTVRFAVGYPGQRRQARPLSHSA